MSDAKLLNANYRVTIGGITTLYINCQVYRDKDFLTIKDEFGALLLMCKLKDLDLIQAVGKSESFKAC